MRTHVLEKSKNINGKKGEQRGITGNERVVKIILEYHILNNMLKETCNVEGWPMAPSRALHIISIPFHRKKSRENI